jgi:two-component system, NtrC family, nitrogen regulation sensor histidine kinase GlnL
MPATATSTLFPVIGLSIDTLNTAIVLLDRDLRVTEANAAFCELFRVGASKLIGAPLPGFAASTQLLFPLAERVRDCGGVITARGETLTDSTGSSTSLDIIAGVSKRGIVLEIHRLASETAATKMHWSQTLRGLAHEVKNPLAGMRGAAQLLARRVADPEATRLTQLIISEVDRLAALSDRLLHSRATPALTDVNLHEVLERARALTFAETEPAITLERDYDPSLPSLQGDADRLLQIILNLLRNAIEANAKSIQMRTRAERNVLIADRAARLAIRCEIVDDGAGVPAELRDTLFLPMVSGRIAGSGLGLALALEIAHEHGGTLRHDTVNARTVFTLLLPLEKTDG